MFGYKFSLSWCELYKSYSVDTVVVCSTGLGNARASIRGANNNDSVPRFFLCLYIIGIKFRAVL